MKKSHLIKGGIEATLEASKAVDELQQLKQTYGNNPNFCYLDNVDENWSELVDSQISKKDYQCRFLEDETHTVEERLENSNTNKL